MVKFSSVTAGTTNTGHFWKTFPTALIHSISQIFFKTHAVAGLLMLAAFAVYDWRMALLVLLGAACAVATALLSGAHHEDVHAGAHGFCGALVGAAAFSALGAGWAGILAAVIGGALCHPVTWLLARLFNTRPLRGFNLPTTTAPFCIAAGLIVVITKPLQESSEPLEIVEGEFFSPWVHAIFDSISQVVLVDSVLSGALILLALFLTHWKVGAAALLGAVSQVLISYVIGAPKVMIYYGLEGYSGVLVAIAMAAIFLSGTWQPWVMAVAGLLLVVPVGTLVGSLDVPVYTWPFVLTTWILLIIARFIPGLNRA